MKKLLKKKAERLRRKGWSYSQILRLVPVSRSTLSLWLRNVLLSENQRVILENRKIIARLKGAIVKRRIRERLENKIKKEAIKEIGDIGKTNLFFVGVALYWAEGSKLVRGRAGQTVIFSNSDWKMISVFLEWLKICLKVPCDDIGYEIYIHENQYKKRDQIVDKWSDRLKIDRTLLNRVYYKRHKISKKYINLDYCGLMRIKVKRSANLNRKIMGWIEGVYLNLKN